MEIERVPTEIRLQAEADLDNGATPSAVWENLNLGQWICLRTWQAHATRRGRARRVERIAEQAAYFRQIVSALGIDTEGLGELEKIKLGAACRGMMAGGTATAMLRAVEVTNDIRRTQLADSAQRMAQEKFDAWKADRDAAVLQQVAKKARAAGGKITVADVAAAIEELDRG